jgi:glycosyltransferase involved in cell wall biosynthesis
VFFGKKFFFIKILVEVPDIIPKISIILPVYNGATWISAAISCVLEQTFTCFELIIIDDGSKDESWAKISEFQDPRIRAIRQYNKGLASTLNIGIGLAKSKYIARQDQDDIMHAERLQKQYEFMENHPECVGVGTWANILSNDQISGRCHRHPVHWDAIKLFLMFDNPFVHSSMLFRRDMATTIGGYSEDPERQPPEDYELWSRMAREGILLNIGETLTAYREVEGSMSRNGVNPFLKKVVRISGENLHAVLQGSFSLEQCVAIASLYHGVSASYENSSPLEVLRMLRTLRLKLTNNVESSSDEFNKIFRKIWILLISKSIKPYDVLGFMRIYRALRRYF